MLVLGIVCMGSLYGCGGSKEAQCKAFEEIFAAAENSIRSPDFRNSEVGKKTCETVFRSGYGQRGIDFKLQKIYRSEVAWPDRQVFTLISSSFAEDKSDPNAGSIKAAECVTNLNGDVFLRDSMILSSQNDYEKYLKNDSLILTDPQIQGSLAMKSIRSVKGYEACVSQRSE